MSPARELGRYGFEPGHEAQQATHATAWVSTADVFARGEDLAVRVELAGVSREDVDITFSSGVLTISGVRRSAKVSGANDPSRPEVVEPNGPEGMQRPFRGDPPRRAAQAEQAHTAEDSHPRQLTQHP